MIRINLLGEKEDKRAVYALQLLVFGVAVAGACFACFLVHSNLSAELSRVGSEKFILESKAIKLREKTKKVTELEAKRKLLAEKLMTISSLKVKKQGPVKILDSITTSIPERAWLLKLNQKGDVLDFNGIALDNQTIAEFINKLAASKYFDSVDLVYSKEYVKDQVALKEFLLTAKLVDLLKLQGKTQPEKLPTLESGKHSAKQGV